MKGRHVYIVVIAICGKYVFVPPQIYLMGSHNRLKLSIESMDIKYMFAWAVFTHDSEYKPYTLYPASSNMCRENSSSGKQLLENDRRSTAPQWRRNTEFHYPKQWGRGRDGGVDLTTKLGSRDMTVHKKQIRGSKTTIIYQKVIT